MAEASRAVKGAKIPTNQERKWWALKRNNKDLQITDWLVYRGETVAAAEHNTIKRVKVR